MPAFRTEKADHINVYGECLSILLQAVVAAAVANWMRGEYQSSKTMYRTGSIFRSCHCFSKAATSQ